MAAVSRLLDVALAAGVAAVGVAEVWVPFDSRQGDGSTWATTVVLLLVCGALTQRRRRPLPVALFVLLGMPVAWVLVSMYVLFFGGLVPLAIAVFSVARWGRGREPLVGAIAGAGALVFADLNISQLQAPSEIPFHWGVMVLAWVFGSGLRRYAARAQESLDRAVEAEVAAAEQAMSAVLDERARIARELHDIVAHAVSTMVVQAGAAEQVVDDDPTFVRQALANIRSAGGGALDEMRRVVAVLRDLDEADRHRPQPGLASVEELVDEARDNGLVTSLSITGDRRSLPAGVDLAAFRIVQEALTNVRRHADAERVDVRVCYQPDQVRLEIVDDGRGVRQTVPRRPGGHGLAGMRERVTMYGGHLETGPGAPRGFVVRAVLPTGGHG